MLWEYVHRMYLTQLHQVSCNNQISNKLLAKLGKQCFTNRYICKGRKHIMVYRRFRHTIRLDCCRRRDTNYPNHFM